MAIYKIKGIELEFDMFEANNADLFEELNNRVLKEIEGSNKKTTLGEKIRSQCNSVLDFFDDLFGDGTSEKVFGESCNFKLCLEAYRDFIYGVKIQVQEMNELSNEISELISVDKRPIDREERRKERRR